MKFLLFGTGEYYRRYKCWFDKKEIVALIDNSKEKQGHSIDDIFVISPKDVFQYEFDAVIILSFYVKAMKSQLKEIGVAESKIYHFFDLHDLIYHPSIKKEIQSYGLNDDARKSRDKKKILLLSHDLTLGGPAIALYHAAQVLKKRGYYVVYGSMIDGPLRDTLVNQEIPVIIDENLMIETMKESEWVKEYSLIICNTMNFHIFLSERIMEIPVAWWLHDALFFYDGVRQEVMDKLVTDNMKIWSAGPIPEKAVKTFRSDFHVEDLLYGVEDKAANRVNQKNKNKIGRIKSKNGKLRFTVIGYIEYRKGQDILLEAIRKLKPDIRQKAEFFFVGQNTSLMAKEIVREAENIPEIVVTGPVDRDGIDSILEQSDLLICPSREDPMPTVAAEAMMHGVPCLISDTAGTAGYIRDGMDGIVFQSGNVEQLKEVLEICIQEKLDLEQMGKNARKVFENDFSMEAFEKRFIALIESVDF